MSDTNATVIPLQYLIPTEVRTDGTGAAALDWPDGSVPFGNHWEIETNAGISSVHWRPGVLNAEECATITAWGRASPHHDAPLEPGATAYGARHLAWLEPRPDNHWLYHRIGGLFQQVNRRHFGFGLVGMVDALQYVEYDAAPDFGWRMDVGRGPTSLRKLSAIVQLAPPAEYDGGAMGFVGLSPMAEGREQGSGTFFPSYMGHRMTPVTRGMRRVLLAWAAGPSFR